VLDEATILSLRANQRFLIWELQRRGVEVTIIDRAHEVFEATYNGRRELLVDIDSSIMPYTASTIASNKILTKKVLARAGVTVPPGELFHIEERDAALRYAGAIGFPVVVKPNLGTCGEQVHVHLEHIEELERAIDQLIEHKGDVGFVVEEHFEGLEYRVFVTRAGKYAVLWREPAYVVGDGVSTIAELAAHESARRMNPRENALGEIVLDSIAETFLRKNGRSFDSVPGPAEKVYVRANSNVSTGGVCSDFTDEVHQSVIEICRKALAAFPGMPYAGIDFMTLDATKPQDSGSYRIVEANPLPGIGMHIAPGEGKSRDVAAMLVDLIFPETVRLLKAV
jgi:cyanophycin synthetase